MNEPVLTDNDRQSAAWKKLKAHYEARLAKLRVQNDNTMPYEDTVRMRGRIDEVKLLLKLGDAPTQPLPVDEFKD